MNRICFRIDVTTASHRQSQGEKRRAPPLSKVRNNSIHVIASSTVLQVKQLGMNFIFAERIMSARSVEVNDVTLAGILQDRLSRAQRLFDNRWKLHVTVAAVGQCVLGYKSRRRGGR